MYLLSCDYDSLTKKLSVENITYPISTDHDSTQISLRTSPNNFVEQCEGFTPKVTASVNQSYASYEEATLGRHYSKLLPQEDSRPLLEKLESLNWEEDKMTTYSEIFEDFHKSENGSDWNVSTNDPFEVKESGFPQTLPTSDIGSIFTKNKSK